MDSAVAAECEDMPAGLENAENFGPELDRMGDVAAVPLLVHESAGSSRVSAVRPELGWRCIGTTEAFYY